MASNVRIELLGRNNYDTWKIQAQALLIKNDNWSYVSGATPKPTVSPSDDSSAAAATAWVNADLKAKSDIILSISASELKQIKHCDTSRDVWLKLESIYQSSGPARKASLLKGLIFCKMADQSDIRDHIKNFFDLVDKLLEMNVHIDEDLLTILLLYSIPDSFENFRCAIESRDDLPTPEQLKIKILEEFDARKEKTGSSSNAFFMKRKYKKSGQSNQNRKFKGQSLLNQPEDASTNHWRPKCKYCHRLGHVIADCRSKPRSSVNQMAAEYDFSADPRITEDCEKIGKPDSQAWCIDSGATSHMCSSLEDFKFFVKSDQSLNLASHHSTPITAKGIVELLVPKGINNINEKITLHEVLHVPDLRTNLLSVPKITQKGFDVVFSKNSAMVMDATGKVVVEAYRKDNLYFLKQQPNMKATSENCAHVFDVPTREFDRWHYKYGHISEQVLNEIIRSKKTKGINLRTAQKLSPCKICSLGKMTQAPFPKSYIQRTSKPLEILHADLCGPMRLMTPRGNRYFVVFTDDYTRWGEVRFLKDKSELFDVFIEVKAKLETQSGCKLKTLQSDNGTEFCNNRFDRFFQANGITRRLTVPHTPQQNGIAERKNRTLVEMARCILLQSGLPKNRWADAIHTANYIRNRCPSKSINMEIPFKRWFGKPPSVSHFQIFGSPVIVLDKSPTKGKFDPRGKNGIFVGYCDESKAYRIYLPDEGKNIISRDVKFFDKPHKVPILPPEIPSMSSEEIEVLFPFKDKPLSVVEDVEESFIEDTPPSPGSHVRRGPGRPKTIKTGKPGRPRKQYNIITNELPSDDSEKASPDTGKDNALDESEMSAASTVSYNEALSGPDVAEWKKAIQDEFTSIVENKSWDIVDRPQNKNVVSNRIILCNKFNSDDTLERRKARLVARGFSQKYGVDFLETYAPVARLSTIRLVIAIAVKMRLTLNQLDVKTAFLNGSLDEEVYMELPNGLQENLQQIIREPGTNEEIKETARTWLSSLQSSNKPKVCLLKKALYGLHQAGRQWYKRLDQSLKRLNFKNLKSDPCVYSLQRGKSITLLVVYVDDVLIATNDVENLINLKQKLKKEFKITDLGKPKLCLGIEFTYNNTNGSIALSQQRYIDSLLKQFNMEDCKPVITPMDPNDKLLLPEFKDDKLMKEIPYQQLIGSLMYLSVSTRPDISYAVSALSQYNCNYNITHFKAAKRVLRYLKGTKSLGLTFRANTTPLQGYVDADWARCSNDRKSYSGFTFQLGGTSIFWESRKQQTVALSSTEAEFVALAEATKEAIYLQHIIQEITGQDCKPLKLFNDNQSSGKLAQNVQFHSRAKHIDLKHHFIRDAVAERIIVIQYLPTEQQPADILTKPLHGPKHQFCCSHLGLMPII